MTELLLVVQLVLMFMMIFYFWNNGKTERDKKNSLQESAQSKSRELYRMNEISLSMPLSEKTRPVCIEEIRGQDEGMRALLMALCGKNPQHILIYGPPGVGKTCAARLALEEAKKSKGTPFRQDAKFIEMDATCVRFDERSIADPLIGSVHDPIYQGAGAYGPAGVPQPKAGAVTKAHGGVLFLDEIGELHPMQINKLLKVMEDRRVFFESAYYSSSDENIPRYVHDIFQKGMPADFRLIGATTRRPEELPPALRSRCIEVFFNELDETELSEIARNAVNACEMMIDDNSAGLIASYSAGGRDAVNIAQLAIGKCYAEGRDRIVGEDIEWIAGCGRYMKRGKNHISADKRIGRVNALGVMSGNVGYSFEIECCLIPNGSGKLTISGFAESEQTGDSAHSYSRGSTAVGSINNVLAVLRKYYGIDFSQYDLHINACGGMLVDGPSAGMAIAVCVYSAVRQKGVAGNIAFTGELGLDGGIRAVGGVRMKTDAAAKIGIDCVYLPKENLAEASRQLSEVNAAECIFEVTEKLFSETDESPGRLLTTA